MPSARGSPSPTASAAVHAPEEPDDWQGFAGEWLRDHGVDARRAVLVTGPSPRNPDTNYRIEFLRFGAAAG